MKRLEAALSTLFPEAVQSKRTRLRRSIPESEIDRRGK